jgi:hypothetical protein
LDLRVRGPRSQSLLVTQGLTFAVVGPKFNPDEQEVFTFRALSVILALSRFVLTMYATSPSIYFPYSDTFGGFIVFLNVSGVLRL